MTSPRPAAEASAHFGPDGSSAWAARRFVSATLRTWGQHDLEDVATLLVSELTGNVVLHARTDVDVVLRRSGSRLRIEVHDGSPRLPERKNHAVTSATGRGLVLVAELSERWGADPTPNGKSVWFELDEDHVPVTANAAVASELRLEDWDDLTDTESR